VAVSNPRFRVSQHPVSAILAVGILVLGIMSTGQRAEADEFMPPHVAAQLGLEQAWIRHLYVPAGAQSIVDQQIVVHESNPHVFIEIVTGDAPADGADAVTEVSGRVLSRISIDQLDRGDRKAAEAEANRLATNEIRRLKRRGVTATSRSTTVPRIYLYTLSDDGMIDCRNAETGQPVWRSSVGDPSLTYAKMGIDDEFLSLINGANLVKVDVTTGEQMQSVNTNHVPLYGSINAGKYALVPTIMNGVEGYPLADPTEYPFSRMVDGMALAPPSKAPGSTRVAWGTNRGFLYVMELSGTPSVLFRLDTDGIVSASVAAVNGDRFFFGSENGQVYGVHATRMGKVLWSRPYADPFYNSPIVYDDRVFLRSTYGNLFALSTEDGFMTWPDSIANVDELIGVFGDRLYVRLLSGHFSVIDINEGETIQTFFEMQPLHFLTNSQTDRLYLLSENGTMQCLRPAGADLPTLNMLMRPIPGAKSDDEAGDEDPSSGRSTSPDSMAPAGGDPFAPAGGDPFAPAGDDPFAPAAGDDPFAPAGGDDPFAPADGGGDMADPFGTSDPFQ
tara:strand:+ start:174783 stop:176462 length:1680 start_codon:yes stop_codon:yes gene_type:complete